MRAPRPRRRPLLAAALAAALLSPLPAALLPSAQAEGAAPVAAAEVGYDRIGVRRGDTWHLRDALDGGPHRSYRQGPAGWTAVAGDFDGDGVGTVSLFRDGVWLLRDTEGGLPTLVRHGRQGDRPVVGDWDGDGVDTIGVFRAGTWVLRGGNALLPAAGRSFAFGMAGDVPVVGDWNGDGRDDVAVRRGARWFQRDAASPGAATRSFTFGLARDVPVAGDWDHDGTDTPGLFRDGTWFFLRQNGRSPYQTTRFGLRGDQPVVRRTPGLAPGVTHHVLRDRGARWVAHLARVDLAAASSPETVLAGDRLRGKETVLAMTRRAGAVLGVNGDFFLGNGRPVHLYANDGVLLQTPSILGRAFSLDATGTRFAMGYPDVQTRVTAGAALGVDVGRVNQGGPQGGGVAGFSAAGSGLEAPPAGRCAATLRPDGARAVRPDGRVVTPLTVRESRCGGPRPAVPAVGTVLSAEPAGPGGAQLRALPPGTRATLTTQLGFPGAVDAMGGNPLLVVDGRVVASEVDGTAPFFARASRTAVGVTARGTLLVVVVDGRQPGWSEGMTLRQLAELLHRLGAHAALNLDGGGSSEMVVNGLVVNRPSDGRERPVANALVVLPGADTGQADLLGRPPARPAPAQDGPLDLLPGPELQDPASTGGLADALRRSGVPLPAELDAVADLLPR